MSIEAGKLRHRVILQAFVSGRDSDGVLTEQWTTVAEVWASVEPLSAREFVAAAATQARVTARIVIRYRPEVVPTMRILHRDKIYNIEGVLADKDSGLEYLTLPCSEGVNQG